MIRAALATCLVLAALALPAMSPQPAAAQEQFAVARPATRDITLTGFTRASRSVTLVSEVSGRVDDVLAEVGDTLDAEGVFAVIDETFVSLELAANNAEQAKLTSQADYLQKEVNRYKDLVSQDSAAQATLDELQQRLDQARLARAALRVAAETIAERLARHQVRGPQGYQVMSRLVEPGDWVATGQPLGTVGLFDVLDAPFALSPQELSALEAMDQPLALTLPDRDFAEASATIHTISPAFDPETRKINVTLRIQSMPGILRGGLRVELTLPIPDPSGIVLLPEQAVTERYDEHWVTRDDNEVIKVVILGPGPDNTLRLSSDQIHPGDRFMLQ